MKLISVQTGQCAPLNLGNRQVLSGMHKTPVHTPIAVTKLGLAGDEQADLNVHGGLSKAVYAYPSEHYAYWNEQARASALTTPLPFGHLGENLTISGLLESAAFVGDALHFNDCVLRITQPRQPCYKLNAVMQDRYAAKKMATTGYCGFYLSVVKTGHIQAGEVFTLVPGKRDTPISALFKVSRLKTQND